MDSKNSLDFIEKEIEDSRILLFLLNGKAIKTLSPNKENEKIVLLKFLKGDSLRKLSAEYGIDRERISQGLREIFEEYPEELEVFDKIVESRKASTTVKIENAELENIVRKVLFEGMTQKDAYESLGLDAETFRIKMMQVINKNRKYRTIYTQKEAKRRPDYSFINFKALLLEMIRNGKNQSEIGSEYGIPARRISREVENLPEEDALLKKVCKMHAKISWRRLKDYKLEPDEKVLIDVVMEAYSDYREPIIIDNPKPQQDVELEKLERILEIADSVQGTNAEKANAAGVSVSTLRRAKIKHEMIVKDRTTIGIIDVDDEKEL